MHDYDKWLAEYKEAVADVRLHSGLMFGELTVYLVASGVLVQATARGESVAGTRIALAVAGVVLSVAFFVLHERFGDFVHVARRRAKELENKLGFCLYRSAPAMHALLGRRIVGAINAARLLFVMGGIGWVGALLCAAIAPRGSSLQTLSICTSVRLDPRV